MTKKKKRRIVHYAAVLFVFLNFAAWEVARESWHQLSESIEQARDILAVRTDINKVFSEVRDIHADTFEILQGVEDQRIKGYKLKSKNLSDLQDEMDAMTEENAETRRYLTKVLVADVSLEAVGPLARQLGDAGAMEQQRLALRSERLSSVANCQKSAGECGLDLEPILTKIDAFVAKVIKEAEEKRNKYGAYGAIAGWTGVISFSVGCLIAMFTDEKAEA
jgi:hypothetical protein